MSQQWWKMTQSLTRLSRRTECTSLHRERPWRLSLEALLALRPDRARRHVLDLEKLLHPEDDAGRLLGMRLLYIMVLATETERNRRAPDFLRERTLESDLVVSGRLGGRVGGLGDGKKGSR